MLATIIQKDMKFIAITIFCLISIFTFGQKKSEIDYYRALIDSFQFDNYTVAESIQNKIEKLDTASLKDFSPDIFANIVYQYNKIDSANFSGHYAIISWGCGSPCQMNAIIDLTTGKIDETFSTSNGLDFKKNSYLLILDPPDKSMFDKHYRDLIGPPKFYIWEKNKLKKLK